MRSTVQDSQLNIDSKSELKKKLAVSTKFITGNPDDFIKSKNGFLKKSDAKIDGNPNRHSATIFTKKPKTLLSQNPYQSNKRNHHNWYGIVNNTILNHSKVYPIITFCGAVARLIGGNFQPKYRYDLDNEILFSKGVEHAIKLQSLDSIFAERLGTDTLISYLLENNDLNSGNCLANEENRYCVLIDYDRCFPSILYKYLFVEPTKYLTYDIGDHVKKTKEDDNYIVDGKNATYMGEMSVRDYDNLPFCRDQVATTWHFMNIYTTININEVGGKEYKSDYSLMSHSARFIAEKHFAALIAKLSAPLIYDLIDIHILDNNDNEAMKKKIAERFDEKLEEIIMQSEGSINLEWKHRSAGFKEFLEKNQNTMIKAVLYHLHQFFIDNRHYKTNWLLVGEEIIKRYSHLWSKLFNKPFENNSYNDLKEHVKAIDSHDVTALQIAKDFYDSNNMDCLSQQIQNQISFSKERMMKNSNLIFAVKNPLEMIGNGARVRSGQVPLTFSNKVIGPDSIYDTTRTNTIRR